MADIVIVQPVDGAARVNFDYGAAAEAIDALDTMIRRLGEQVEGRAGPHDRVIVGWEGHYRQEFERAWELLNLRFTAGVESAAAAQTQIHDAVGRANDQQRRYNQIAEEARIRAAQQAAAAGATPI